MNKFIKCCAFGALLCSAIAGTSGCGSNDGKSDRDTLAGVPCLNWDADTAEVRKYMREHMPNIPCVAADSAVLSYELVENGDPKRAVSYFFAPNPKTGKYRMQILRVIECTADSMPLIAHLKRDKRFKREWDGLDTAWVDGVARGYLAEMSRGDSFPPVRMAVFMRESALPELAITGGQEGSAPVQKTKRTSRIKRWTTRIMFALKRQGC